MSKYHLEMKKRSHLIVLLTLLVLIFCYYHTKHKELSLDQFSYPINEDISVYVNQLLANKASDIYPINVFDYEFDHIPKCKLLNLHKNEENIRKLEYLTIIVKSSVKNVGKRLAIRKTWGAQGIYNGVQIRTLFNLGRSLGSEKAIQWEASRYKDIIQSNFQDTYLNLTIKTIMGMKYAYHYCQSSNYFIFVDDDMYVSRKNAIKALPFNTNITFYSGDVHENSRVYRSPFSKWYISYKDYPYSKYPSFVSGTFKLLTRNTLQRLYFGSYFTKLIHLEDAFTGIVAFKLNISPTANKNCYSKKLYYVGHESYKHVIASHGYDNIEEMINVWAKCQQHGY